MIDSNKIAEYIKTSTEEVFSTMLGMELAAGEPRVEKSPPAVSEGVMSLIGMAGQWTGAGTISCNSAFACKICAQLLMSEAASVDEEVLDAMGEMTNMVIGNFKTLVEQDLGPLGLSIPTVIYGRNFSSRSVGDAEWVVIPFESGGDKLEVRVCLSPAQNPTAVKHGYSHASTNLG